MLCLLRNRASLVRTKMLTIAGKAIVMSPSTLTLGQFSRSPVIAAFMLSLSLAIVLVVTVLVLWWALGVTTHAFWHPPFPVM